MEVFLHVYINSSPLVFLEYFRWAHLLEFLAALAGSFYLYRTKDNSFIRTFVGFLWLTFSVECIAMYAQVAYYSDYRIFSFVANTPFIANYWLYNIYSIIAFSVYIGFFTLQLDSVKRKKSLFWLLSLFILAAIANLIVSDVFFIAHSVFTFFAGTIVVLLCIGFYYFKLLHSDEILEIKYSVPFYISIGALVYHLGFVPLVIYSRYFNQTSPEFVEFYTNVLYGINYFLYSIYILGFLICSKKKKSSLSPT